MEETRDVKAMMEDGFKGDAGLSLEYACKTGKRFEKGEQALLMEPVLGVTYAAKVLKGPWPELEMMILHGTSALSEARALAATKYCREVRKEDWPEAWALIAQSPRAAFEHALWLKGREAKNTPPAALTPEK